MPLAGSPDAQTERLGGGRAGGVGAAAMGEGLGQQPRRGGSVDWIRKLRREQCLPVPTMWAILPSEPNPRLEPARAAAAQEPFRPRCLQQLEIYPEPRVVCAITMCPVSVQC